ncbi:DMT family transporter, partial [Escherichia coli]|uniref:DMT family transporter n=1 Tax=Escherichia coli TaxID=562 RepID=UPI001FCED679
MKGWLFLVIAIVGEVIATSALKSSEGFTKLAPSAVVIIGYGIAFYFLSHNRLWHRILFSFS